MSVTPARFIVFFLLQTLTPLSVLADVAAQKFCPFFDNRAPSTQPNLQNCSWFKENSCCLDEEIASIFPTVLPPDKASKKCLNYIRFQMCFVCDPDQANYYSYDQLTLCEEYCNDMWTACEMAEIEGQVIGNTYTSGKEYCESLSFNVAKQSSGECFTFDPANAASSLTHNPLSLLAAIYLSLFLGRGRATGSVILLLLLTVFVTRGRGQALQASDVKKWALAIGSDLVGLTEQGLKVNETQNIFNGNDFTAENIAGSDLVSRIAGTLEQFFSEKQTALLAVADEAAKLHQQYARSGDYVPPSASDSTVTPNQGLGTLYSDADFPKSLPKTEYSDVFKKKVSFDRSVIKLPDAVPRSDARVAAEIKWTNGLDALFNKSLKNDASLRWQYFASPQGMIRVYPSYEWQRNFAGFHEDYDPRIRPWYVSSTSGPKNVIIILDCSSSMLGTRFQIAKAAAKTILNTLTQQDFVNVICARDSYYSYYSHYRYFTTRILGCVKSGLLPATPSIKRDLMEKIDEIHPDGRSLFTSAMQMTMDAFLNSPPQYRSNCQNVAIFLTDGLREDGNDVRCEPGSYTYSYSSDRAPHKTYHPGRKCNEEWTSVWDEATFHNPRTGSNKVHFFTYGVVSGEAGQSLPTKLACDNHGSYARLYTPFNVYENMTNYYDFLAQSTERATSLVWTAPYVDIFGLGLVVTIAVPIFAIDDKQLVGVIGVDATLEGIENLLNARTWGSAYSFLINSDGDTIVHPRLKPSAELVDDPVYPRIEQLEQANGLPKDFTNVRSDMLAGKNGSRTVTGPRFVAKGDFQDGFEFVTATSTYYYQPVSKTDYFVAINIPQLDMQYRQASPLTSSEVNALPTTYYYRIDEYAGFLRNIFPMAASDLDVKQGSEGYSDLRVALGASVVKLAPRAFCDPLKFLVDAYPGTQDVHQFLNSNSNNSANPGCYPVQGIYARAVRPDTHLTSKLEPVWKKRPSLPVNIAWTYMATQSGVWRVFPGTLVPRQYDPTARPWYKRAIANPGKVAISSVYLDSGGIGKVVTLSQVIYQAPAVINVTTACTVSVSKPPSCPCSQNSECASSVCRFGYCTSEHVAGVVAMDLRYPDFYNYVIGLTTGSRKCGSRYFCAGGSGKCETKCYLVDDVGGVVLDDEILAASDADDRNYAHVPFGFRQGKVMNDLTYNKNLYQKSQQRDFQGICSVTPYALRVTNQGVVFTAEEERQYIKTRGAIRRFGSVFGCVQDVVVFSEVPGAASKDSDGVLEGSANGPCGYGNYFAVAVPETNLYLVVVDNWNNAPMSNAFNFNCHIANRISAAGAFRVFNETCTQEVEAHKKEETCPATLRYTPQCLIINKALTVHSSIFLMLLLFLAASGVGLFS